VIIIFKHFIPKGFIGLTIYPFVFLQEKKWTTNKVLINHERIHLKQQLELLIIPFFIIYFLEFLYGLFIYKNKYLAYKNISFEREAYQNESNMQYLKERSFWNFLKYLRNNDF